MHEAGGARNSEHLLARSSEAPMKAYESTTSGLEAMYQDSEHETFSFR